MKRSDLDHASQLSTSQARALPQPAGVTLNAVATAPDIPLDSAKVIAEGDLDFRGTLGVDKETAVGFKEIRLHFALDTDADREQIDTLLRLTERYCVVLQTLRGSPEVVISLEA